MNLKKNRLLDFTIMTLLFAFIAVAVTGCGQFSVFKELNVKNKDIPEYQVTGKAILGEPGIGDFSGLWATLEAEVGELVEEDARKIAADYITGNIEYSLVSVRVKSYEKAFLVEYYKDAAAVEKAGLDKKFDQWPAVSFEDTTEKD